MFQILLRLTRLCIQETAEPGVRKPKKHEQRLLRNMSAPNVVLELLQISYEFVRVNTASDQSCVIHLMLRSMLGDNPNFTVSLGCNFIGL